MLRPAPVIPKIPARWQAIAVSVALLGFTSERSPFGPVAVARGLWGGLTARAEVGIRGAVAVVVLE